MSQKSDVAIIGMACIFPGAPDLATYWQNIMAKVDAVGDPPDGWYADPGTALDGDGDGIYTQRGGYLGDLARFDPVRYGVMPASVAGGEPDQFLALRVAQDTLADGGYLNRLGDPATVEVILGKGTPVTPGSTNLLQHSVLIDQTLAILRQLHPEHTDAELHEIRRQLKASLPPLTAETVPAVVPNILTGRIANRLDLMGTNYTIDAACASSLIAVERGMEDLRAGKCELALVGGVQASTSPAINFAFCQIQALSRTGRIRPFSKDADGTLLGQGIGMVLLKRREAAELDGDRIYAVLKAVGSASDGRALGLLTPRQEGQALALRRAYESAGFSPDTVELVEAHGTGTVMGDLTEVSTLKEVFGPREGETATCALGTVKSMISHLVPAAGIAGLIKTALALHHRALPPTICDDPSPGLGLEGSRFYLNTEPRPWIHGDEAPRRAGVNAFGFGGINAHAILEEHPVSGPDDHGALLGRWDTELFLLRANSQQELVAQADRLALFVAQNPDIALSDLAYRVHCRGSQGQAALAIVASSVADLSQKLTKAQQRLAQPECQGIQDRSGIYHRNKPREGRVAFLFPGEGSQYPTMLSDLCLHFPEVRDAFDRADRVLAADRTGSRLRDVLFPPPSGNIEKLTAQTSALWDMDLAVSAVFVGDYGVLSLLRRLGVEADGVAGHSSGEFAALVGAGAIEVRDPDALLRHSLRLKAAYEAVAQQVPAATLMTVGGVDHETVERLVAESGGSLSLAMDNCPHQMVVCGIGEQGRQALTRLQERGICGYLPFSRAYHTQLFEPVAQRLARFYDSLAIAPPRIPIYSCATAQPYPDDAGQIRSLAAAQWARPVRFRETVEAMYAAGFRTFVEVGAKAILTGFVADVLRRRPHLAVAVDQPGRSGTAGLNHVLGLLAVHGVPVQLDHLFRRRQQGVEVTEGRVGGTLRPELPLQLNLPLQRIQVPKPQSVREPGSRPARSRPSSHAPSPTPPHGEQPATPLEQPAWPPTAGLTPTPRSASAHFTVPPVPAPSQSSATTGVGPRDLAMDQYLRTMDRFLDLERAVLATAVADRAPSSAGRFSTGEVPAPGLADLSVVALQPGRYLVATCRLDRRRHRHLHQHTLGGQPSARDPMLSALPVVPLMVSVEILAQVATMLCPGRCVIGLRAVRVHRWIAVEGEQHHLRVIAERSNPNQVVVRVVEEGLAEGSSSSTTDATLVEGTVLFGDDYPVPPAPLPPMTSPTQPYPMAPHDYYTVMFHGPVFQCVTAIQRSGGDGIDATLQVSAEPALRLSPHGEVLHTDPVLLDGATQAVGFWARHQFDRGFAIFPLGFQSLDLYEPFPTAGTPVACAARISRAGTGRISSDVDLRRGDDRVIARLTGLEHARLLDWTPHFIDFVLSPRTRTLATPWSEPVSRLGDVARCCRIFDSETGGGSWSRILASIVLSRQERRTYARMAGSEGRRREWLLGRVAAKDAVRVLLQDRHRLSVPPADVEIVTDGQGPPRLAEELQRDLPAPLVLSIAHSAANAVAVAAELEQGVGIGVDLEQIGDPHQGLDDAAFDAAEQDLLHRLTADQQEWLLRMWCAKEAASKAFGCPPGGPALAFRVQTVETVTGSILLQPPAALVNKTSAALLVQTGRVNDLVFATTTVTKVTR